MKWILFDIETDGLLDTVTKMHCMSYCDHTSWKVRTVFDIEEACQILDEYEVFIGHNIIRYDLPVLKLLASFDIQSRKCIDTLAVSWYLQPNLESHGLEFFGQALGVPKLWISDWKDGSPELYQARCERDVDINTKLWLEQKQYLEEITENSDVFENKDLLEHLQFKMECLRDQEEEGIQFDHIQAMISLGKAKREYTKRVEKLKSVMPNQYGKVIKTRPKQLHRQDGTLTVHGERWFEALEELSLPFNTEEIREEPNPGSHDQLKQWLFSLGWQPQNFKESKATGKKVPLINLPFGQGVCPSVKVLYDEYPDLEQIEGMYMLKHRIGVLKSMLQSQDEKHTLYATAHGFTNTLRLTHSKPITNLPGVKAPWGKEIRECLVAPENYYFVGCDIKGLESATAHHFISFFDPRYVEEMRTPGFDPHLDLGLLAKLITPEEVELFKRVDEELHQEDNTVSSEDKARYKSIKGKRSTSKVANFAMQYNAKPPKIAETAKISLAEAKILYDVYWQRNWALKTVSDNLRVKKVRGQFWQWNPVAKFWYFLKKKKDKFSTLNQGTGAFVFDTFLRNVKQLVEPVTNHRVCLQIHDEFGMIAPVEYREQISDLVKLAMQKTNEQLQLNVTIEYDIQFGKNYADVH